MSAICNRHDFVYIFDVKDGNPNGDPDAGNLPRLDPETLQGLVSDVCLKRKVRNFVTLAKDAEAGYRIYVAERGILEHLQGEAWDAVMGAPTKARPQSRSKLPRDEAKARALTRWMCANFYYVRAFGAVMSTTAANCGQVRGPVQLRGCTGGSNHFRADKLGSHCSISPVNSSSFGRRTGAVRRSPGGTEN